MQRSPAIALIVIFTTTLVLGIYILVRLNISSILGVFIVFDVLLVITMVFGAIEFRKSMKKLKVSRLGEPTRFSSWFTNKRNFILLILIAGLTGYLLARIILR